MQTQQTPQVLQQPFAAQGDKNTIPNAATGTNKASLQEGFPPITGQPINQGGIPPERQDFNGAMNLNSQFYFAFQNGWLPTFSQEVSDAIGGYPQGAVLWYQSSEGLQILESAIPNNTNNFITNPSVIGTAWTVVGVTQASVQQAIPAYFYTQISNCITKIPQDINIVLNTDGTVTVKTGTKAYIPNGSGVFDSITTVADLTVSAGTATGDSFIFIAANGSAHIALCSNCYSGSTAPSDPIMGYRWYDTTNNKLYGFNSDGTLGGLQSLPIAKVYRDGSAITRIDQVFNGFGYIGQTLFVLPGVEGLSPNGRNADGSLKNELMTLDHVVTRDYTWNCADGQYVFLGISQEYGDYLSLISTASPGMYKQQSTPPDLENYITWHRLDENKLYRTEALSVTPNWVLLRGFAVGPVFNTGEGTNVSSWNIARPVSMLDMSNTSYLSKMGMPSDRYVDLTLGATSSDYIAPANGYIQLSQQGNSSNNSVSLVSLSTWIQQTSKSTTGTNDVFLPVKSGDKFRIFYNGESSSITRFRFIYAEGEK